jgi:hypothetical protein
MCTILYLTFKITVWLWKTPDINAIKKNKDVAYHIRNCSSTKKTTIFSKLLENTKPGD